MRKVIYEVNGLEIPTYKQARKLKPIGQIKIRLEHIEEACNVNIETREKRVAAIRGM